MNVHISAVHERKMPFECKFCDKRFSRKDNLNVHISAIYERKMPFESKFCDKKFSKKAY